MKTIFALNAAIEVLGNNVRNISINGFEYAGGYRSQHEWPQRDFMFKFKLVCSRRHLQVLKNYGVKINFDEIKKMKHNSIGINGNTITTMAIASMTTLMNIEKFTRDNHLNEVDIHNDYQLANSGWIFKKKHEPVDTHNVAAHIHRREAIRKQVRKLSMPRTTPYQMMCATKYNF